MAKQGLDLHQGGLWNGLRASGRRAGMERNKLLQIGVEPSTPSPIYCFMQNMITAHREYAVQVETIQKFLADSRLYLAR